MSFSELFSLKTIQCNTKAPKSIDQSHNRIEKTIETSPAETTTTTTTAATTTVATKTSNALSASLHPPLPSSLPPAGTNPFQSAYVKQRVDQFSQDRDIRRTLRQNERKRQREAVFADLQKASSKWRMRCVPCSATCKISSCLCITAILIVTLIVLIIVWQNRSALAFA